MAKHRLPFSLMVACGSVLQEDGYSIRVRLGLRAVRDVQGGSGSKPTLLSFESWRGLRDRGTVRAARHRADSEGIELRLVPLLPKKLPRSVWFNMKWCSLWIRRYAARARSYVVHAQGHAAAGAVCAAFPRHRRPSRIRTVFDVHGADIEERLFDGRMKPGAWEHRMRLHQQVLSVQESDWLLPVTKTLAQYLAQASGVQALPSTRIVPCVSTIPTPRPEKLTELRFERRAELGIGMDVPVLLYVGGAGAWQQPGLMMETFKVVLGKEPKAVFLVLSGDHRLFLEEAARAGVPGGSLRLRQVPHMDIAAHACAADVALLLRADTALNRVASPTKFAEYLASAAPVVLTGVLGDFAGITRMHGVGEVVSSQAAASDIAAAVMRVASRLTWGGSNRIQRCLEVVEKCLSYQSILPIYSEIYRDPDRVACCGRN